MPDAALPPPVGTAPVVVVRTCGLPVRALDALRTPETLHLLRDALDSRAVAEGLAAAVEDDLYQLVPRLDDHREARRAALRLRRDVHNLRAAPGTETAAERVGPHLDGDACARLGRFLDALRRHDAYLAKAEQAAAGELADAGEAMLGWLRRYDIALGLALASPLFVLSMLETGAGAGARAAGSPAWDSRLARSAAAYLTRAAVKPSPFSTLATVGVAGWDGEPGPGTEQSTAARRELSSSRAAALELLRAEVEHPDGALDLEVVANPSLRRVGRHGVGGDRAGGDGAGGELLGVLPLYAFARGVYFREDELTACDLDGWAVPALPTRPRPLGEVLPGAGTRRVRRLVGTGVLHPVTPWLLPDGRHFRAFAARLAGLAGEVRCRRTVEALAALEAQVADAEDPGARATAAEEARTVLLGGFRRLHRRPPGWLPTAALFHETVATAPERVADLPGHVRDRVHEVGRRVGATVRRATLYDRLVEFFVRRHGPGGTAPDLLTFCYELLSAVDPVRLAGMLDDRADSPPTAAELRGHGTVGPPSSVVFFQLAGTDASAGAPDGGLLAPDGGLLVVNSVQAGLVGSVARWGSVPALHDRLAEPLAAWLGERHPGCVVYQVSAHTDWVEFQRPVLRPLPRAGWGSDLADGDPQAVDLAGFSLTHEPATGTLQARDTAGRPAAFVYLGAIPSFLLRGVDRLLHLLSCPWLLSDPHACLPAPPPTRLAPTVTHRARLEVDGVVWQRERWRMDPGDLPRPARGTSPVAFLTEVERWRRRWGLPEEVFLSQVTSGAASVRPEKPQWVGFDAPHVVWSALCQVKPDAVAVDLVEALPGRHQHGGGTAGDAHAIEHAALVRHG